MQVAGGVLMVLPRTRPVGAPLLACTMVGAIIVDLAVLGTPMFVVPMMLLFLLVAIWAVSL